MKNAFSFETILWKMLIIHVKELIYCKNVHLESLILFLNVNFLHLIFLAYT
jgi:hypothetical protein